MIAFDEWQRQEHKKNVLYYFRLVEWSTHFAGSGSAGGPDDCEEEIRLLHDFRQPSANDEKCHTHDTGCQQFWLMDYDLWLDPAVQNTEPLAAASALYQFEGDDFLRS